MRYLPIVFALGASACAPSLQFGNEAGGIVDQAGSPGNKRAFEIAETHCEKYGKIARITGQEIWVKSTRFECVAR